MNGGGPGDDWASFSERMTLCSDVKEKVLSRWRVGGKQDENRLGKGGRGRIMQGWAGTVRSSNSVPHSEESHQSFNWGSDCMWSASLWLRLLRTLYNPFSFLPCSNRICEITAGQSITKDYISQIPLQPGMVMWLSSSQWDVKGSNGYNFGVVSLKKKNPFFFLFCLVQFWKQGWAQLWLHS